MTQKEEVKQYMIDFGSITPMEAFYDLGITKLSTRISEMIRDGEKIIKEVVHGRSRKGKPMHYMKYRLEQ